MSSIRQRVLQSPQDFDRDAGLRGADDVGVPSAESATGPTHSGDETATGQNAEVPEPRLMLPRISIDAFLESELLRAAVQSVASDRRAVRSGFEIHRGGFAEAMERYGEHPAADLIVIEDSGSADHLEWRIEALADLCPSTTRLVVIGECNDIALYRRLIRIGVSDYLVQPVKPLTLLDSIASIFMEEEDTKDLGVVIAFVGARGGVGSSTLAHNAAAIFTGHFDATTLLIDAAIGFGTAALQFDVSSPQGLADALKEGEDLDGEVLERLTHWRDKRFGILTAPDRPDQMAAPEPGTMRHVVDQARRIARYVVLDLPHGWSPSTVEALAAADRVVLVATPDLPSLRNARTLLKLLHKLRPNDEPAHLVLNRIPTRGKPAVSTEDFARILDRKVAAAVPFDDAATSAEMAGRVLAEHAPGSEAVQTIASFAGQLAGRDPRAGRTTTRRSLLGRLFAKGRK